MASRTSQAVTFQSLLLRRKEETAKNSLNLCSTIACHGSCISDNQHNAVDAEAAQCEARMLLAEMRAAAKMQHEEAPRRSTNVRENAAATDARRCARPSAAWRQGDGASLPLAAETIKGHVNVPAVQILCADDGDGVAHAPPLNGCACCVGADGRAVRGGQPRCAQPRSAPDVPCVRAVRWRWSAPLPDASVILRPFWFEEKSASGRPTGAQMAGCLAVCCGKRRLEPQQGHAAAAAGAACLLHLHCGGRGGHAGVEAGVEGKIGHLRPLDEWVNIPCIEVSGREASLVLERLHHSGGRTISVQVQKCLDGTEDARIRSVALEAARSASRYIDARSQRRSGAAPVSALPERPPRAPILPDGADDWMVLVPFEPDLCVEESRPSIYADQRKPIPRPKFGPGY